MKEYRSHISAALYSASSRVGDGLIELARAIDEQHAETRLERLRDAQHQFRYVMDLVDAAVAVETETTKLKLVHTQE